MYLKFSTCFFYAPYSSDNNGGMSHTNIQGLHEIPERYSQWFHVITELNQGFYEITEYDHVFMNS